MKNFSYKTHGTCSTTINFCLDDNNCIHNLQFIGGCNGNLQGISHLVEGEPASKVLQRCAGICCGMRPTSCPDQLSQALKLALNKF